MFCGALNKMSVLIMVQRSLLEDLNNTSGLLNCCFACFVCKMQLKQGKQTHWNYNHMCCWCNTTTKARFTMQTSTEGRREKRGELSRCQNMRIEREATLHGHSQYNHSPLL